MEPTRPAGGYGLCDTSLGLAGRLISTPLGGQEAPPLGTPVSPFFKCPSRAPFQVSGAIINLEIQNWGDQFILCFRLSSPYLGTCSVSVRAGAPATLVEKGVPIAPSTPISLLNHPPSQQSLKGDFL